MIIITTESIFFSSRSFSLQKANKRRIFFQPIFTFFALPRSDSILRLANDRFKQKRKLQMLFVRSTSYSDFYNVENELRRETNGSLLSFCYDIGDSRITVSDDFH